jgi:general secretion pathway protein J
MGRRGFTLLEIIVAVAITAAIGATIAAAFTSGFRAKEMVESEAEQYRGLRTSFDRMVREIGAAFVSDRYDVRRYRDQSDRPTNFIGSRDRLVFTSLAHQRLYADAKESDQMVVEYSVKTSTKKGTAHSQQDLMRRENPNVYGEDKMERGGAEEVLLEDVKRIEFSYWDSDQKDWVNDWDTRKLEKKSILPTRVRFTVVRSDESGHEQRYTTEARVMLNTEIPRF